jgi:hypothetical protein
MRLLPDLEAPAIPPDVLRLIAHGQLPTAMPRPPRCPIRATSRPRCPMISMS